MNRCPLSYETLEPEATYSLHGLKRLHRKLEALEVFPYSAEEQRYEAAQRASRMSIQGMQPKVSALLRVSKGRFEMVDSGGRYIVKPQHFAFRSLPENEDLTMRLAAACGIEVPVHGLVRCRDKSLSYVIRRFDREGRNSKLPLEDFAQLSGRNRKTKYDSSLEKVAGVVERHCTFPLLEKLKLFRRTLFCFICGNEDMHLKNFSLIVRDDKVELSPAYDLLNTTLAMPGTLEELALPLNGKGRKLKRSDWLEYWATGRLGLPDKVVQQALAQFENALPGWKELIERSFLERDSKIAYEKLIDERMRRLNLSA